MASSQQTTAVVYAYKKTYSGEIDWSIKSLKNLLLPKNVYVVGDEAPESINIKPLPNTWASRSRYHDTINKYYTAALQLEEDQILLMNDDFFIMQPWKPANYNRGTLLDHMEWRKQNDDYQRRLDYTNNYLLSRGMTNLSFELHTPMLVDRVLLKQAIEEIMPQLRTNRIPMLRSYYGNRFEIETEYMADVKNPSNYEHTVLLSTNNRAFEGQIGKYIRSQL